MCRTLLVLMLVLVSWSPIGTAAGDELDWNIWPVVSVQSGGREKPLDTLAREMLRVVANRTNLTDPETGDKLGPVEAYLSMLFDWDGLEHPDQEHLRQLTDWRPLYFHLHEADKWDKMPLLPVDFLSLRIALGMGEDQEHIAPAELASAKIEDVRSEQTVPFPAWVEQLRQRRVVGEPLTELEKKGLELADRLGTYQNHRMGRSLEIVPVPGSEDGEWMPLARLWLTQFDYASDPGGKLRAIQELFARARRAYRESDAAEFNKSAEWLAVALRDYGGDAGDYPRAAVIWLEVFYNRWAPFRIAWLLMLAASLGLVLHWTSRRPAFRIAALAAYGAGIAVALLGLTVRVLISGRPPVTNMYESLIYVGTGIALLGLVFEQFFRKNYALTAAAIAATVAMVLADNSPLVLDPSLQPLEPVLRSNFWLVAHVMTITLCYAAFALAMGLANIALGHYLLGSTDQATIDALSRFTYKANQVGVLLLLSGIILGGVWADYAWGRFWGWDPKEVWALIALLGYLAVLHACRAGWVNHLGLAVLSVLCFLLVVMAWYGVNFVLGTGLHAYGFAAGAGQGYVFTAVLLQVLFVVAALIRSVQPDQGVGSRSGIPSTSERQASDRGVQLARVSQT